MAKDVRQLQSEVHYNLARCLEEEGSEVEARYHWSRFLELTPDSPWADEALSRLESSEGDH